MATRQPDRSSRRWAVAAGVYMSLCGATVVVLLSDLLGLLADVIGQSTAYWPLVLAAPAVPIGAAVWWVTIERRESPSYLAGTLFGFTTALLTGLLWAGRFVQLWGVEMVAVRMHALLIAVVLGFTTVSGVLAAPLIVYLRRRASREGAGRTDECGPTPES